MLQISELMPNPVGKDAGSEYVVLFNNSSATIRVVGWQLVDAGGKKSLINVGPVAPGGQIKVAGDALGISLNNSDETVRLVDPSGKTVDSVSYGSAPAEGVPLLHAKELTPQIRELLFDEFVPRTPQQKEIVGGAILSALVVAGILAAVSIYILRNVKPLPDFLQNEKNKENNHS